MSGRVVWQFRTLFLASVLRETGGELERRVERERDLTGFACNEGSWSLLRKLLTEGGWRGPVFPLISQNYTISRARCGVTPFVFASDEGGGRSDRHRHILNLINEKSFDP